MNANSKSNNFDPDSSDRHIEVEDLVKLDANQTINELRVENNDLKKRLEVLERHFNRGEATDENGIDEINRANDTCEKETNRNNIVLKNKESKVEQLVKWKDSYKNATICLKHANNSMMEKFNRETKYFHSQMSIYVEKLKTSESNFVHASIELNKYRTAYEDQQVKTMACFKYLHQMKTKYEDRIQEQETLLKLLNQRMKHFLAQQGKTSSVQSSNSTTFGPQVEKMIPPDEWGLQEKIEYLELKFINERRDRILNRLLFENEQLRKLIENDFYQTSENHFKKRIKTNEDSYLEYFRRDSIYNRLILCEKKRLNKPRNQYQSSYGIENQLSGDEFNDENENSDDDDDDTRNSNIVGEKQSENEEEVADDEDASSTTLSEESEDIVEESLTNLMTSSGELLDTGSSDNRVNDKDDKEENEYDTDVRNAVEFSVNKNVKKIASETDNKYLGKTSIEKFSSNENNIWTKAKFPSEYLDINKSNECQIEVRDIQVMLHPQAVSVDSGNESIADSHGKLNNEFKHLTDTLKLNRYSIEEAGKATQNATKPVSVVNKKEPLFKGTLKKLEKSHEKKISGNKTHNNSKMMIKSTK